MTNAGTVTRIKAANALRGVKFDVEQAVTRIKAELAAERNIHNEATK